MAGEQDGHPLLGEAPDQQAHVAHARRVKTGRGLVEQQQLGVAQQRRGDPEPLAHAVRVAADAVRWRLELDRLERCVDLVAGAVAVIGGQHLQVAPRAQVRIEGGRLDEPRHALQRATLSIGSRPNRRTLPSVGRIRPSIIRSEVVLPAPLGPRYP